MDLIKQAMGDQKKEEKQEEVNKSAARSNIIIYGIEEKDEKELEARKKLNESAVTELLTAIGKADVKPTKMHRLGKFSNEQDHKSPRPLKVYLNSMEEAIEVVKNCKKLKSAEQHLKKLSISHDLTRDERSHVKELVNEAKDKSKNSQEWDYKVTGNPWEPAIQRFRKRPATTANRP